MKAVSKKMLKEWIGEANLNNDNLLRLITELLNGSYKVEDCREDVFAYLDVD
jgi:hypothetical protein